MTDIPELLKIQREAEELLTPLTRARSEDLVRALRPRPEDYARVFVASAADTAQTGYGQMWNAPPKSLAKSHQTEVRAFAADSASLVEDNEYSRNFPGGYRKIAHLLKPGLVWVMFRVVAPGESSGMAHDGLVKLDDHWAWFPKPWRILASDQEGN
jgi:hypothetical protein